MYNVNLIDLLNKIRMFIALDIHSKDTLLKLQAELIAVSDWLQHKIKPVEKENFHFTIIFLGEVDLRIIDELGKKLSELEFDPIKVTYTGIGVFPNSDFPRIIWVGVDERSKQKIVSLFESITSKIRDLGFKPDKQFTPHITLFRNKMERKENLQLHNILPKYKNKVFGLDVIDKIQLKRSDLTALGPVYSNMFTIHAK
jgi:RNA 2',3'-cyclic 3'-phosphodiesterase